MVGMKTSSGGAKRLANEKSSVHHLTMDDVARLAGVDKSTVSRALAGNPIVAAETREHVRKIAESHGYVLNTVASGLRSRRSKVIAVVIPLVRESHQQIFDPFFMAMVAHLADCLAQRGYDLLLSAIATGAASWISALQRSRRADGVILVGQSLEHDQIAAASAAGVPLVVWGARLPDEPYLTVGTDNVEGGRLATAHLLARGRRSIAFIGDSGLPEIGQRYAGFVAALNAVGMSPDPGLLVPCRFEPDDALRAARRLIAGPVAFDGIVAASDVIAMAALQALSAAGLKVPEQVSVTGFDDILMAAHTTPALTTIRQDIARGARLLTERILELIDGKPIESVEMPPSLVIRGST
jgi:DNA-binding LacI/PurR family transcriptional regulator